MEKSSWCSLVSGSTANLANHIPGRGEPEHSCNEGCGSVSLLAVHPGCSIVFLGVLSARFAVGSTILRRLWGLGGMNRWQPPDLSGTVEIRFASKPPSEVCEEAIVGDLSKVGDPNPGRIPSASGSPGDHQPETAALASENQPTFVR